MWVYAVVVNSFCRLQSTLEHLCLSFHNRVCQCGKPQTMTSTSIAESIHYVTATVKHQTTVRY